MGLVAGRYEILRKLGRGGMGEVYLAFDNRLATEVTLKRVPFELSMETGVREALVREARILARLTHTNIVRLFDLEDTPDGLFIVLEFVAGPTLQEVLEARKLSFQETLAILRQVAHGLRLAHSKEIIHRDLKPSNLMIQLEGDEQKAYLEHRAIPRDLRNAVVKVTDFGIARVLEAASRATNQTNSGTPLYMAPEQFRGEAPSVESDVYALGLIVYEALAGAIPLNGMQPAYFHLFVTPPPIEGLLPSQNAAIAKALAKEREERFHSAREFLAALQVQEPGPAISQPRVPQAEPRSPQQISPQHAPAQEAPPHQSPPGFAQPRQSPPPPDSSRAQRPEEQPPKQPEREKSVPVSKEPAWKVVVPLLIVGLIMAGSVGFVYGGYRLFKWVTRGSSASVENRDRQAPLEQPVISVLPKQSDQQLVLNPPPFVSELPPVIESAKPVAPGGELPLGPRSPVVLGTTVVPSTKIAGFAQDGTVFLADPELVIAAVRENRLLWAFSLRDALLRLAFSKDGLIWIRGGSEPNFEYHVFNAAGQGGLLRNSKAAKGRAPGNAEFYQYSDVWCGIQEGSPMLQKRGNGEKWRVTLDHGCSADPQRGIDGSFVLQTRTRMIYRVSAAGKLLWNWPAPCESAELLPLREGGAFVSCKGQVFTVRGGQVAWSATYPGEAVVDREDALYFRNSTNFSQPLEIYRVDASGNRTWGLKLEQLLLGRMQLSPKGTLLLTGRPGGGKNVLIEIGDRRN
jgi:serine/threonine protein kinase